MDKWDIIIPSLAAGAFALLLGSVLCALFGPLAPAHCCLVLSIVLGGVLAVLLALRRRGTA